MFFDQFLYRTRLPMPFADTKCGFVCYEAVIIAGIGTRLTIAYCHSDSTLSKIRGQNFRSVPEILSRSIRSYIRFA